MLTHERLKEVLNYDQETGVFTWKIRLSRRTHVGERAGVHDKKFDCIHIKIDGKSYLAHRLAWFYVTGVMPTKLVDHRNRIRTDNSYSNLREATPLQNQHNRATAKGYCWSKQSGKWVASIRVNYKSIHLGSFDLESDARQAYLDGCLKYHGAEWSGNKLAQADGG